MRKLIPRHESFLFTIYRSELLGWLECLHDSFSDAVALIYSSTPASKFLLFVDNTNGCHVFFILVLDHVSIENRSI